MKKETAQTVALWKIGLKAYLILSALMFIGGMLIGGAFVLSGHTIPRPF